MGEPLPGFAHLKALLQSCSLFQEAEDAALDFVARHCEEVAFEKGECVILENEANDSVYFVKSGSIEILSYLSHDKRVQRLALLKPGSHFAEFSVLTKSARSGSAYAYEDCELLKVDGASFIQALRHFPALSQRLVKLLAGFNQSSEKSNEIVPFYQPDQLNVSHHVAAVMPAAMWRKFGVIPVSMKAGLLTVLMKDPTDQEFFQHVKGSHAGLKFAVHLINEHEYEPAVVRAIASMKTAEPPPRAPKPASRDIAAALTASHLFGELPADVNQQIAPHLQVTDFQAGADIFTAGQKIEAYGLVLSGHVQMLRPLSIAGTYAAVTSVTHGDGFGETQILTDSPTVCAWRALEPTSIIFVPKGLFVQLLQTPLFTVPLAKTVALRLQTVGHITGLKYFKPDGPMDFRTTAKLLPITLMEEQRVLPLKLADGEVTLGVVNPDNSTILVHAGRYLAEFRVRLLGISDDQFQSWFRLLKTEAAAKSDAQKPRAGTNGTIDIVQWVDRILLTGIENRASDIHIEPSEDVLTVRYRIDGVLREHPEKLPSGLAVEAISRIKILSGMDIGQKHMPQDGGLKHTIGNTNIVARASILPIKYGEKVVLRLIRGKNSVVPLNMLAPDRRTVNILKGVTQCSQGLFLVTGPTGSGKTTTLYSMLGALNEVGINVITLEEPVEMEINGFAQVEVDRKRGLDFATALRSVLRQDPDVIMVGEIRDAESAKIVFEAAVTGHLVLSTLHASFATDVVPRLTELGVPNGTMATGLLGVLSQRLLRGVCKKCISMRPTTEAEKELLRKSLRLKEAPAETPHGRGCIACDGTGYHDRIPVFETWRNTLEMRNALMKDEPPSEILRIAREDGYETLFEFGLKMVLSGFTTIEEVKRVLSSL